MSMVFLSPRKLAENRLDTLFGSVLGDFNDGAEPIYCGLDEAGRGPWAGPVVACALVFKKTNVRLVGVKDSKKLSAQKREELYQKIARSAYFGIGRAEAVEIDELGLLKATKLAYERALEALLQNLRAKGDGGECKKTPQTEQKKYPLFLLIDGRDKFNLPHPAVSVIKGDEKVKIIACASIMAKVERDRIMREMAGTYPGYGFELHKGYGTAAHQKALADRGVCAEHRKSYRPVQQYTTSDF